MSCIPQPRGLEEKKNKEMDFTCFRSVKTSGIQSQCSLEWSSLTPGGHIFCWSLALLYFAMYQPQQLCFQGWMQNIRLTYGKTWLTVGTKYPGTPRPQYSFFDQGSLTHFTSAGWLKGIPMIPSTSHLLVQVSGINHSSLMATVCLIKAYDFKKI